MPPRKPLGTSASLCSGETTASPDLTHLFFSTNKLDFAAAGLTQAPGSAYDDDLATGRVELISKTASGNIPQDPAFAATPSSGEPGGGKVVPGGAEEFLRFPAVSTDGSHVLISTATAGTPLCDGDEIGFAGCPHFTGTPIHLYMRVGGGLGVTYEIAESPTTHEPAAVNYVGMTPDGKHVYFTSEQHLTHEDESHTGRSLYMWSENEGDPTLTLISKPDPGSPPAPVTPPPAPGALRQAKLGFRGWNRKRRRDPLDHRLRRPTLLGLRRLLAGRRPRRQRHLRHRHRLQNGDIYFYSPEQLDGDRGVPGQQNLYDYRAAEATLRYVATFTPEHRCGSGFHNWSICSEGPILRLNVSPDDSHVAFLTASQLTSYDNTDAQAGCGESFEREAEEPKPGPLRCTELYSYTPAGGRSSVTPATPDGRPPSTNVFASQDGLFMTDDGRTFFSTTESLVPSDTNEGRDVYEYVDGRPQLITPGTGTAAAEAPGIARR